MGRWILKRLEVVGRRELLYFIVAWGLGDTRDFGFDLVVAEEVFYVSIFNFNWKSRFWSCIGSI